MSVRTDYDDMRYDLKKDLEECLEKAEQLVVGKKIWGYEDMRKGYAIDVYQAILKAIETI